jgi:SAM-dependent methyltransferase
VVAEHPHHHPFDAAAANYDRDFSATRLGRRYRERVWAELATSFQPGDRVLELGCGTGEDAVWLARRGVRVLATDASAAMLAQTRRKVEAAGVQELVATRRLDLGELGADRDLDGPYDGVLSNFGALNCVPDRRPIARALAGLVVPGGRLLVVVMAPVCPWEVAWHLLKGEPVTAFRRLRQGAPVRVADGHEVRVWYPSPGRLRREFKPLFRPLATAGIGCFLPPPYLEHLEDTKPAMIRRLAALEERWSRVPPFTWLADHIMLSLERCS